MQVKRTVFLYMKEYRKFISICLNPDETGGVDFIRLFGIFFIVLAGIVIANSDFFRLCHVEVVNNRRVSKEEILLASGLTSPQTIFQVKPQSITASILKNPSIDQVKVEVNPPDTVWIKVKERIPLCWVAYANRYLCVADDGVIIDDPVQRNIKLPLISGCKISPPHLGKEIVAERFPEAITMLLLMDAKLRQNIAEIDMKHYRLVLQQPGMPLIPVELGNSEKIEQKIANLRAIAGQVNFNDISGINLRVPDIPTVSR